jgi:DNA-binding NarL/FixJ family response regulator
MGMRVLLADDYALVRTGLKLLHEDLLEDVEVDEASSFNEAPALLAHGGFYDLVALNVTMSGFVRSYALEALCTAHPDAKFVPMSANDARGDIIAAISAGAGYIPKGLPVREIAVAFDRVLRGSIYVPDALGRRGNALPTARPSEREWDMLTNRQRAVLTELLKGQSSKQIAHALCIAEGTVKIHLAAIYRVLGVRSRAEAIARCTGPASRASAA